MAKNQEQDSSIIQHQNEDKVVIHGGCHCQAIRFKAKVPKESTVLICNCSICSMTGFQHLLVSHEDFTLLSNSSKLSHYQFNTGQAKHLFCQICGVKSFYQPRSHPNSWSVNTHCIDGFNPSNWAHKPFDGQNWQQAKDSLDLSG